MPVYKKAQLLAMSDEEAQGLTPAWQSKRQEYLNKEEETHASKPVEEKKAPKKEAPESFSNEDTAIEEPGSELVTIYIDPKQTDAVSKRINGEVRYFQQGNLNGKPFEVECGKPVQVRRDIRQALQGVLNAQKK